MLKNKVNIFLYFLIVFLVFVFGFSIFKNIKYPLMWGDEAETAVFAERILQFGYPKVHDGKNVMNLTMIAEKEVGVKESVDAWIHLPWLQYYFAVVGVFLAKGFSDMYTKTALVRIPFAAIGFLGTLITPLIFSSFVKKRQKITFYILYLALVITSVPLVLHLREVRSYSLNLLIITLLNLVFIKYYFGSLSKIKFYLFEVLMMLLAFNNYPPTFIAFFATVFCYLGVKWFFAKSTSKDRSVWYFLIFSLILIIPFAIFYETFYVSYKNTQYFPAGLSYVFERLVREVVFLTKYSYLLLFFLCWLLAEFLKKRAGKNAVDSKGFRLQSVGFLRLFLFVYILITALQPYTFDRYYVVLTPFIILLVTSDIFALLNILGRLKKKHALQIGSEIIFTPVIIVFLLTSAFMIDSLIGHWYELNHRYLGVLDYVIPYLKSSFKDTDGISIETLHEQTSYIYYLGSSVLSGYNDNKPVVRQNPDVIVPDNFHVDLDYLRNIRNVIDNSGYKKVSFEVSYYPANNIPEFSFSLRHLFRTKLADSDSDREIIFIKK